MIIIQCLYIHISINRIELIKKQLITYITIRKSKNKHQLAQIDEIIDKAIIKMKESRRQAQNFQQELQDKLNKLTQIRSQKKIKYKSPLSISSPAANTNNRTNTNTKNKNSNELELYQFLLNNNGNQFEKHPQYNKPENRNKNKNTKTQGNLDADIDIDQDAGLTINLNEQPKYSIISESRQSNNSSNRKPVQNQESGIKYKQKQAKLPKRSNLISKQTSNMVWKIFDGSESKQKQQNNLSIEYFLAKCLAQYSPQQNLPQQQIKQIYMQLQKQLTTTDENIVSINALQLQIKKHRTLEWYIIQKILKCRYALKQRRLQNKYTSFQDSCIKKQQGRKAKEKQLVEFQKQISHRQKQVIKKEKQYANKQRQLMERIKNNKKMLQQKAEKLYQKYHGQILMVTDKLEKKISAYERNMKYKIQSITNKANQIHRLKQTQQSDMKDSLAKQIQEKISAKYNKQHRKQEQQHKQLENLCESYRQQIRALEQQNCKLVKICQKLQNKLSKDSGKLNHLLQDLEKKNYQIKELQFLCRQKQVENQELIARMFGDHKQQTEQGVYSQVEAGRDKRNISKNQSRKQMKITKNSHQNEREKEKQGNISKNKSKKSLSSKKKQEINKAETENKITNNGNVRKIKLDQIIDICEDYFKQMTPFLQREFQDSLSGQILERLLKASVKLLITEQEQHRCSGIIQIVYVHAIRNQDDTMYRKSIDIKQCSQLLKKYISSKNNNKQNLEAHISKDIWKLCVVVYLFTSSTNPSGQSNQRDLKNKQQRDNREKHKQQVWWIHKINQLLQSSALQDQVSQHVQKENNFIHCFIIKFIHENQEYEQEGYNIQTLAIISDFVLTYKLTNRSGEGVWSRQVISRLVQIFHKIAKLAIKNSKYLESYNEHIEKISIMIQRLIAKFKSLPQSVNHHGRMDVNQYCNTFYYLINLCKGTLLQRNLNSIINMLQTYSNQNGSVLAHI